MENGEEVGVGRKEGGRLLRHFVDGYTVLYLELCETGPGGEDGSFDLFTCRVASGTGNFV
jgi:hypothetical protein